MLENGFMSESETESWRQHLLCDDILRPLGVLRQLIEKTGFRIYDAWGIALGADKTDYLRGLLSGYGIEARQFERAVGSARGFCSWES